MSIARDIGRMEVAVNIWVETAKKGHICRLETCGGEIRPGEMVLGTRIDGEQMRFHAHCWLKFCEGYVGQERGGRRGRRKLMLSDEDRERRFRLLRQYSTNRRRMEEFIAIGDELSVLRAAKMAIRLGEIRIGIERLGGLPRSWATDSLAADVQEMVGGAGPA